MIDFPPLLDAQGRPLVRQTLVSPSVYLDTWALRLFSEYAALGARFRHALLQAHGTLVLSDINLLDFTSFDDPRHAQAAAVLIDSVLPHIFLTRSDPFVVMERELRVMLGQMRESPAGDENALRVFAEGTAARGGRLTVVGWFASVHRERGTLAAGAQQVAAAMFNGVNALRDRVEAEPGFRSVMRRGVTDAQRRPRSTQALLRAIIEVLEADRRLAQNANTAIDLLHSIVPSAYCDFVLLDAQWHTLLTNARRRLVAAGIRARIARVFTQRRHGVERFLEALEGRRLPEN